VGGAANTNRYGLARGSSWRTASARLQSQVAPFARQCAVSSLAAGRLWHPHDARSQDQAESGASTVPGRQAGQVSNQSRPASLGRAAAVVNDEHRLCQDGALGPRRYRAAYRGGSQCGLVPALQSQVQTVGVPAARAGGHDVVRYAGSSRIELYVSMPAEFNMTHPSGSSSIRNRAAIRTVPGQACLSIHPECYPHWTARCSAGGTRRRLLAGGTALGQFVPSPLSRPCLESTAA